MYAESCNCCNITSMASEQIRYHLHWWCQRHCYCYEPSHKSKCRSNDTIGFTSDIYVEPQARGFSLRTGVNAPVDTLVYDACNECLAVGVGTDIVLFSHPEGEVNPFGRKLQRLRFTQTLGHLGQTFRHHLRPVWMTTDSCYPYLVL